MADAHYTFVPWLRQGIAARIDAIDHLAAQPDAGAQGRAGVQVELVVDYVPKGGGTAAALPSATRRVEMLGPGDIVGIKPATVLRVSPHRDAINATPGELAFVEFFEEDFPWRFTPARVATADEDPARVSKLRPWLALFVLRADEHTVTERAGELPILTINVGVALPPVEDAWAWAHAQIGGAVASAGAVDDAIRAEPARSLSRLLCPRRLVADTSYAAFVVPAFETGRLAGLKVTDPGTAAQKPSWGATAPADRRFPIYHRWEFRTNAAGDFEDLARKLVARQAGERLGKRAMAIDDVGYGMPRHPGATVDLEGALRPTNFQRTDFPGAPGAGFAAELRAIVDLSQDLVSDQTADLAHPLAPTATRPSAYAPVLKPAAGADVPDDPIVTPTAYGRFHAGVLRIADAESDADLAWLRELNLDPRSRAAAGLGTEVVTRLQDELMDRAWKQVGAIEAANQHLREAELAAVAGDALHAKHLAPAGEDRLLTITAAAQRGLAAPAAATPGSSSLRAVVAGSRVPVAAQSAAFKRVSRPQRKVMRRLTGTGQVGGIQGGLLTKMNLDATDAGAVSTARPRAEPGAVVALPLVATRVADAAAAAAEHVGAKRWFLDLLHDDLAGRLDAGQDLDAVAPADLIGTLSIALGLATGLTAEAQALVPRVQAMIAAIVGVAAEPPDGAAVTLAAAVFDLELGADIAGKNLRGVTVRREGAPAGGEVARTATADDLAAYQSALADFTAAFVDGRPPPAQAASMPAVTSLATHVKAQLQPRRAVAARVTSAIAGLAPQLAARPATTARPLRPVMASPRFEDPMFEPLRKLSQDYILPNLSDLPNDTITLMEPNPTFIEAYLAGLNVELARELLWREYPTDQRGTYFDAFWDTRDAVGHPARPDIKPMHTWKGALGGQSQLPPDTLVLVIRGELLKKYPNTIVYAHEAAWAGDPQQPRVLAAAGAIKYPAFHATLEPDVAIFGFDLSESAARGYRSTGPADPEPARPGWFFVLKERPGQLRFGADDHLPATGFQTWDDLAWDQIALAAGDHARASGPGAPAPADPAGITWGTSSAHVAYAMFQSPVLYARHAAEMLP